MLIRQGSSVLNDVASRHVLLPLHRAYRASRPHTRAAFRAYAAGMAFRRSSFGWPVEQRRTWMLERLRFVVRYAWETTAYYRALFDSIGFDPRAPFSFDDYAQLPVLEREDIHGAGAGLLSSAVPFASLRKDATGGSSGVPTTLWKGPQERGWSESGIEYFMQSIGLPAGSRTGYLWGHHLDPTARTTLRERMQDRMNNVRWYECLRLSSDALSRYHDELQSWRPHGIIAYASALGALAEVVSAQRAAARYPTRGFVTGAEKLLARDRTNVERAFGRPVHERYGSRDAGLIGFQLEPGCTLDYTVDWPGIFVEPETSAATSSVLVTKLHADGMPMLRYRIGDLARFASDSRPGQPTFTLREVIGREVERLWLPDGQWFHGLSFPHLLKDFPVVDFQVEQAEDLSVVVRLVREPSCSADDLAAIQRIVEANLRNVPVRVQLVDEIPRTRASKRQPVVSRARQARVAPGTAP